MSNNTPAMPKTNIDTERLRAAIFLKYGYKLDDTSIVILYILTDQQTAMFSSQNKKMDAATEKINDSQRSLQVDKESPRWQAFMFGFGKFGLALIMAMTFGMILFGLYLDDKKENRPAILEWYKNYYLNTKNLSHKKAVDYVEKNPMPKE